MRLTYIKCFLLGVVGATLLLIFSFIKFPFAEEIPLIVYAQNLDFKSLYSNTDLINNNSENLKQNLPDKIISFVSNLPLKSISSIDGKTMLYDIGDKELIAAVMVENHVDSRPGLSGLNQAKIIYETEAEGGITRFMGIFNTFEVEKLGPIRSARPYFVGFAEEYSAVYAHAGGSPPALQQVHSGKILNAEALYYEGVGKYFFRDKKYYAPHNLFGNLKELSKLVESKDWQKGVEKRFEFITKDFDQKSESELKDATNITLEFSRKTYRVNYKYNAEKNYYERMLAGKKHIDHLDESQFTPANIIVQFTTYKPYDNYGRLNMITSGSGKSYLFTRGKIREGTWTKRADGKTEFKDEQGNNYKLTPGQTWIEVIKPGSVKWEEQLQKA